MAIRIAIVSDIHVTTQELARQWADSHVVLGSSEHDPLGDLLELVKREGITADVLLCAGDITDRANPEGLTKGWDFLHSLASEMQCSETIATAGNHDVDSRLIHQDYDVFGPLKGLSPPFPTTEPEHSTSYWGDGFAVVDIPSFDTRVVALNSCFYHGILQTDGLRKEVVSAEDNHGRVGHRILDTLRHRLDGLDGMRTNILLVHHHARRDGRFDECDASGLVDGEELLRVLADAPTGIGPWLMVHGHRHVPSISYEYGAGVPTVVLSSASLASRIYLRSLPEIGNQFHILDIDPPILSSAPRGRFSSYDFSPTDGWIPSGAKRGLPASGGFGFTGDLGDVIAEIATTVQGGEAFASWEEVLSAVPDASFLAPRSVDTVLDVLHSDYGVSSMVNDHGVPSQLEDHSG